MNPSTKTLLLYNANIVTLGSRLSKADWVAARNGRICQLGFGKDWKNIKGAQDISIDLDGKTVIPGFIDAHMHIVATIKKHLAFDLAPGKNLRSVSDLQTTIRNHALQVSPGEWMFGKGYNEFYLAEKRHPNRWDLDQAALHHPVKLTHRSGHTHVLNSMALKSVGITHETGDPDGGIIDRDLESGKPTGILYGMGDFLSEHIPPPQESELEIGLKKVNQKLLSFGITSLQEASHRNDLQRWELLKKWVVTGNLQPRVCMLHGYSSFRRKEQRYFTPPPAPEQLKPAAVKIMIDNTTGRMLPEPQNLAAMVSAVHRAGMQAAFHAIDESSIEAACQAVAEALEESPKNDHRHRIEHCSVCSPGLAKKIASLRMSVVSQPPFLFHNGERYLATVPEKQRKYLYPFRTLMSYGVCPAGSSDSPVVPADPLTGIYAAVKRLAKNGPELNGHEKISVMDALRMYPHHAASVAFEEDIKGSITPGKLADLVVLDEDPTCIPADDIKYLKVDMTIINGKVVWRKDC